MSASPLPTGERRDALIVAGIVAGAERALGGLDGRTVAIEGWDQAPRPLAAALAARGATVVAVSTASATIAAPTGLDAGVLADPAGDPAASGGAAEPAGAVWATAADVVVTGSKAGVLDHTVVDAVQARAVVPWGPVPVTAKALAALRRRDVVVLPDFVVLAGPSLVAAGGLPADAGAGRHRRRRHGRARRGRPPRRRRPARRLLPRRGLPPYVARTTPFRPPDRLTPRSGTRRGARTERERNASD